MISTSNNTILSNLFRRVDKAVKEIDVRRHENNKTPRQRVLEIINPNNILISDVVVVAGFSRSIPQFKSAIRLWALFCSLMNKDCFPVENNLIRSYVAMFSVAATCRNYFAAIKNACLILGHPTSWNDSDLKQLKTNVSKLSTRVLEVPEKRALTRNILIPVLELCQRLKANDPKFWTEIQGALVLSYTCLFRLPSECLPLRFNAVLEPGAHSAISCTTNKLQITLARRKNVNTPSVIVRDCVCKIGTRNILCPVHMVHELSKLVKRGEPIFSVSQRTVVDKMRLLLRNCDIPHAEQYCTHALRRGGARDLYAKHKSIEKLMAAGFWVSKEWATYLNSVDLATEAVFEMLVNAEEEEE